MCGENCKCKEKRNKIYVSSAEACYTGYSLVAAKTAEEANDAVKEQEVQNKLNFKML